MTTKKQTLRAAFRPLTKKDKEASQPSTTLIGSGSLIALRENFDGKMELQEVINVALYFNERGNGMQPVRACVWINPPRKTENNPHAFEYRSGSGSAGGCGYHKQSAAVEDALDNAGVLLFGEPSRYLRQGDTIDLKKQFYGGGTGSGWYEEAFKAIAKAMGYKGKMAWVAHGMGG